MRDISILSGFVICAALAGGAPAAATTLAEVQALFPQTTARPLFAPTRRPPPAPAAVEAPTPQEAAPAVVVPVSLPAGPSFDGSGLELRGVFGRAGSLIALIEPTGGAAPYRLGLGAAELPGATGDLVAVEVLDITPDRIVIRGDQVVTLTLRAENDTADGVATVDAETMLAAAPTAPVLIPAPQIEASAAHTPQGVLKTSLFTISASN